MMRNVNCILCGRKLLETEQRCPDCIDLKDLVDTIYNDARAELSANSSVEREPVFKLLREYAFVVQEDALLRTYKQSVKFFLNQFIDKENSEIELHLYTKKVPTRLNQLKILKEFSDAQLIDWRPLSVGTDPSPKIYPGPVIENLKTSYNRITVNDRTEQRFGHAMGFYSILPLLSKYGSCGSRDETRMLNVIPKKPWAILLAIIIANRDGKINLERTNIFLKKRRGIGNVYGTILTNLNSLSTDHTQKATVGVEEMGSGDRSYVLDSEIVKYVDRIREITRGR